MNFAFALTALALSCAAISLVYAMAGSEEPDRWAREGTGHFLMMFGGILGLAAGIFLLAKWIG